MSQTKKKISIIIGVLLALLIGGYAIWQQFGATTKIALVNFPGFQSTGIVFSNTSKHIKYDVLKQDDLKDFRKYDYVIVFGMGLKWDKDQHQKVVEMTDKGFPLQVLYATVPENDISGLDSLQTQRIMEYLDGGGKHNYQNFAYYVRKYVDKKKWYAPEPGEWVSSPTDVFYHLDDEVAIEDKAKFDEYLKENGFYHPGAPNILIIGGITDPYSGAKSHIDSLIRSLDRSGLNVYPVTSFMQRLDFIQAVRPDLIVYFPHGRLLMGQGEAGVEYLKQLNIPMLTPLTLLQSEAKWREDKMGMVGGFLSQTVVMPELDGALYPYAVFSQETTKDGYEIINAMPHRLASFTQLVHRFLSLKTKSNADKKVAIYFFKGPGQEALAAQGLETVPSLYNMLLRLRDEGYNVDGLPDNIDKFRDELRAQGDVFESYEAKDMTRFVNHVAPELVSQEQMSTWIEKDLDPELQQQLVDEYGPIPGEYFVKEENGAPHLIIPRLRYGNIAIIPQPMSGIGSDKFQVIHGAKMPPPYPYVGAYLWAREAFGADAMMHFGTHGSLEFTPSKQVILGDTDWGDQLIGALPHFYYYTIGNVGEGIIAKRRSYAATVSYLTPAFSESGARGVYAKLQGAISKYFAATTTPEKEKYADEVKKQTIALGIHRELRLDSLPQTKYTGDDIERIDSFAEEIASEKVNGSLYTTGEPYTSERLNTTVIAMCTDPIAYSKAKLDQLGQKNPIDYTKNRRLFNQKYLTPATAVVKSLLRGGSDEHSIVLRYLGITADELQEAHDLLDRPKMGGMPMGKMPKMSGTSKTEKMPSMSDMAKMGAKNPHGTMPKAADNTAPSQGHPHGQMPKADNSSKMGAGHPGGAMPHMGSAENDAPQSTHTKEWAELILDAEKTILNVRNYHKALLESPNLELTSIVNALNGGYTAPTSGGDAVANPNAIPTGRNLYSINAEATPSERAWHQGVELAEKTIQQYQSRHDGEYPTKVSYTFWSSEFIESQGASIAQVLYMLGVEPIRDSFGRVSDLQLIPASKLGRPRIDVVVQTSGQFRDLAASRLALITKAIEMAAAAPKEEYDNFVSEGAIHTEKLLVEMGMSPKEARSLSTKRIFGGINGMYGTGIQEMITSGDKWDDEAEIAEVYLNNMGASYSTIEEWGEFSKPLFRAALANTDIVVQPRQSNSWGALSLDHVYEFMGGLNLTVRQVTGKDPDAYFADYRNHHNFRMQDLKEAIGVESRSTILNPAFVKEMIAGGASSLSRLTEITTNTYGWNVAKPEVIEDALWDDIYDIYINDKFQLNVPQAFEQTNPQAMQEATAVMMETIRKGMWAASPEQINKLAEVHADLTEKHGALPGGMASRNMKLQQFIKEHLKTPELQQKFQAKQNELTGATEASGKGVVMSKDESALGQNTSDTSGFNGKMVAFISIAVFAIVIILLRRKRKQS